MDRYNFLIIDPEDGQLVPFEEWSSRPDPTTAQLVVIIAEGRSKGLVIYKKHLVNPKDRKNGHFRFDEAQKAAQQFSVAVPAKAAFRCPTRLECIVDLYDARYAGLDEVLSAIGGDTFVDRTIWTCEEDPDTDPEFREFAFLFCATGADEENGCNLANNNKACACSVRPVSSINLK